MLLPATGHRWPDRYDMRSLPTPATHP